MPVLIRMVVAVDAAGQEVVPKPQHLVEVLEVEEGVVGMMVCPTLSSGRY